MQKPLYRFENIPEINFPSFVPEETDADNIYGKVVARKGDARMRYDGAVLSFWEGPRLILTIKKRAGRIPLPGAWARS